MTISDGATGSPGGETTPGPDHGFGIPGFADFVSRAIAADAEHEEAIARNALTDRVRDTIGLHLEGHRGVDKTMRRHVAEDAANAAVAVFLDILTNPPTRVTHPDGHVEIQWPEEQAS